MKTGKRNSEKGFTLIELLVVVAILGVLATVAIPNVARFMNSGNDAAIKANVATYQVAEDAYAVEHNGTYQGNLTALYPVYIKATPTIGNYTIDSNGIVTGTP